MLSDAEALRLAQSARRSPEYKKNSEVILNMNDGYCYICDNKNGPIAKWKRIDENRKTYQYDDDYAVIDHYIPIKRGGDPIAITNLRLAHRKCNGKKGDKMPFALQTADFIWDTSRPDAMQPSHDNPLRRIKELKNG